ncbi:MAG: asparagine synthase (glutamine-hydrolyzing), partial [Sphingobacteriales bacterium]
NDDNLVITFNGEIYNYLELKDELKQLNFNFSTKTDTEVILAAYSAWGKESFNKLKGMFALALHDRNKALVYLVRDKAGIKPLYYATSSGNLTFASEVKAFSCTSEKYTENTDWKVFLLAFGHIPEPFTTLANVQMLPKASVLEYHTVTSTYKISAFTQKIQSKTITSKKEAESLISKFLSEAVKRHLIADARIGIFLSGGVDSSLLTLIADKNVNASVNTLSINFDDEQFSEKKFQNLISSKIKFEHAEYTVSEAAFNSLLPRAMEAMDQPTTDGINSWFVNYYAKQKNLKAVLSGVGADELFGGYPSFKRMRRVNLLAALPGFLLKAGKYFNKPAVKRTYYLSYKNAAGKYLFLRGFFTPPEISKILNLSLTEINTTLNKLEAQIPKHLGVEEQASWLETNLYMQNQLLKDTDFMSMQHGVEVRVPFLDEDVVAAVNAIHNDLKYKAEKPKNLLIDAFYGTLPETIWNRKKMGFTFPFQNWLVKNDFFIERFNRSPNDFVDRLITDFKSGKVHWSKMMAVYQVLNN